MQAQGAETSADLPAAAAILAASAPGPAKSHTSSLAAQPSWKQSSCNSSKHQQISTSFQPSRQWLSVVWMEAMRPSINWAHRYMSTIKGRFWCMDHTFATAKCVRDANQQTVYKAVLTIVNEYSQLVAQYFTYTTSLHEVRRGLKLLLDRYQDDDLQAGSSNF